MIATATNMVVGSPIPVGKFPAANGIFIQPRFAGTPGKANCFGRSVAALARTFGGLNAAASALGFPSIWSGALMKGAGSQQTPRWSKPDSNLYGAFPVKWLFWVLLRVLCSERERPFFVPSPAIRFAECAEGVKGPKR